VKRLILTAVAATIGPALATTADSQESTEARAAETTAMEPPGPPDIIVRGRRIGELRFEIERAEEAVFARFNEINSTDDFDIHCRSEKVGMLKRRFCMSNSWREQSANMAGEMVRAMNGQRNFARAQAHRAEQLRTNQLLADEMRQLAAEDEQLRQAFANLSEAELALTTRLGNRTLSRQVSAISGSLPYEAELIFEIIVGNEPWRHRLTRHTFTIAHVFGEIRRLRVECAEGSRQLDYEIGVDWTLPSGWSSCVLQVNAKKETTFRLYEF
jgi:hypothetical protein